MKSLTTADVKIKNTERIIRYIYEQKCTSQQLICAALQISRPTVIPILRELEEKGIIEKQGFFQSTGGRKAAAISFCASSRIAIGLELRAEYYEMVALDLYGTTLSQTRISTPFQNVDSYYAAVCAQVSGFIAQNAFAPEQVLGVGIVLQGLISADETCVTYGKILNCTGLTTEPFTSRLPYPCKFFHDAESAATDELWQRPALTNALYMNIRSHVSCAIIVNRTFLKGTELKSGVFEHMTLVPGGRPCYCGHKGCMETYCSTQPLSDVYGDLDHFFSKLRSHDPEAEKNWRVYLRFLASAINNLHMFIDYPVILGGQLACYLTEPDLDILHQLVYENTAFPTSSRFISISHCKESSIARGGAIPYLKQYLSMLTGC